MTREEISEYNKLCAEFLGYKYFPYPNVNSGWRKEQGHLKLSEYYLARTTKDLKFHSDWNMVIRMVEAIEKLNFVVEIITNTCLIQSNDGSYSESTNCMLDCSYEEYSEANSKKQSVVKAVYEFLKYYNNENGSINLI